MGGRVTHMYMNNCEFKAATSSDAEKIGEYVQQNDAATLAAFVDDNDELQLILDGLAFPDSNAGVPQFVSELTPA